jgi:hypothetical protein
MAKKVQIEFDIENRDVKITSDGILSLTEQVKILRKELLRTQEGTDKFDILSQKLNQTRDDLTRVNTKNRELLATFSLIPGPIGEIFGKLNGVVGLLKTFSGFSLKDISNQFRGFGKDIVDIINGFYGVKKAADDTSSSIKNSSASIKDQTTATEDNTDAQDDSNQVTDEGTAATNAGTVANQKQTTAIEGLSKVEKNYIDLNKEKVLTLKDNIKVLEQGIKAGEDNIKSAQQSVQIGRITEQQAAAQIQVNKDIIAGKQLQIKTTQEEIVALEKESAAVQQNTTDTNTNTGSKKQNTAATGLFATVTNAATFAVNALNIALKALGIGAVIGLVTVFADKIIKFVTSIGEATEASKQFRDATQKGNQALQEAKNNVDQVGIAFDLARKGTIEKKDALKEYNKILGGTIGQAKTFAEAEDLYNKNTANYIKATGLRAEAQALYAIAAQKSAEATVAVERGFFSFERKIGQGFNEASLIDRLLGRKGELEERTSNLISDAAKLKAKADELLGKALPLESGFKGKDEKTGEVAKKENENKQLIEKERELQAEITALKIKGEQEREIKILESARDKEKRDIQAMNITKDKEGIRTKALLELEERFQLKKGEIIQKYADEAAKKKKEDDDKFAKDQEEAQKKLIDIEIGAIEQGASREREIREAKYNEDKKELKKLFDDKLISEKEYQLAVINLNQGLVNDLNKIKDDQNKKDKEDRLKKLDDEIRFLQIQVDAEKNSFVAYWKDRQLLLDKAKQRELEAEELTGAQKTAIEKKYVQLSKDLQREKFEAYVGYLNQGLSAASNVLSQELAIRGINQQNELDQLEINFQKQQEYNSKTMSSKEEFDKQTVLNERELALQQDQVKEKYFNRNKDAQYALALINASQAAISAYASLAPIPVVGPVLGAAAAAVALGYGIAQANAIKRQKYVSGVPAQFPDTGSSGSGNMGRNYEEGGLINGPRHAQGGVMIEAEGGEAVMTRGAVTMFAPLLSAMNQMGGGTSFTKGAAGQAKYDAPKVTETITQPQIVKTYVVSSELTTEAQKQARLKDLSTL